VSREAKVRQRRPEAATYLQRVSMAISVLVSVDVLGDILGISFWLCKILVRRHKSKGWQPEGCRYKCKGKFKCGGL
jgi:hypothetical protein